ncbi:MAG: aldehyde dehydrogenase (NADP(+)), partial [Chitinophagales bacterium]
MFRDANKQEMDECIWEAWEAFHEYRNYSLKNRAAFMRLIAKEFEAISEELIQSSMKETHLPEPRLRNEMVRTVFQLNSYADACERGEWLDARIDQANPSRTPPKPDLRKMLIPLGPVVVFGASNFPFAYSTAGGDTACAFAAGCPVVVKAHPAHAETSEGVANAIRSAVQKAGLPKGIFGHLHGAAVETGKYLIQHPNISAVGFTGSFAGGKALFDWANQRKIPIPVFSEMGSINPVFLLPQKLSQSKEEIAKLYAGSITLSVGQFCTNPGLVIGLDGPDLNEFIELLGGEISKIAPGTMLHPGIAKSFSEKKALALAQKEVETVAVSNIPPEADQGIPTIASAGAEAFLNNPILHQEVFGPYSLVIRCRNEEEMLAVARKMEGQLTATLMATESDFHSHEELVEAVKNICGRFILNGVPTGVEVCLSMQHGGPFPATTDSRFTSVGADGIRRFARPISFQNWPDSLLPD